MITIANIVDSAGIIDERLTNIRQLPEADPESGAPGGMFLLQSMPQGVMYPDQFEAGSRRHMESVVTRIEKMYRHSSPELVADWKAFMALAPATDLVFEWIADNPLQVPLFDLVFSAAPVDTTLAPLPLHPRSRVAEPVDAVNWNRRNQKRKRHDVANRSATRIISGPTDVLKSVPVNLFHENDGGMSVINFIYYYKTHLSYDELRRKPSEKQETD